MSKMKYLKILIVVFSFVPLNLNAEEEYSNAKAEYKIAKNNLKIAKKNLKEAKKLQAKDKQRFGNYSSFAVSFNQITADGPNNQGEAGAVNEPDDKGFSIMAINGYTLKNGRTETELGYTQLEDELNFMTGHSIEFKALHLMQSYYFDMNIYGNINFIVGAGAGIVASSVDTNYSDSGVTFNGSEKNFTPGYHATLGIGIGQNFEVLFRHANLGEIEGASGTMSDSSTYNGDKADYINQSLILKFNF